MVSTKLFEGPAGFCRHTPAGLLVTGECVDDPGWADSDGSTCANYTGLYCSRGGGYINRYETNSFYDYSGPLSNNRSAFGACCGCGGVCSALCCADRALTPVSCERRRVKMFRERTLLALWDGAAATHPVSAERPGPTNTHFSDGRCCHWQLNFGRLLSNDPCPDRSFCHSVRWARRGGSK